MARQQKKYTQELREQAVRLDPGALACEVIDRGR